jgi:hypothetical protein
VEIEASSCSRQPPPYSTEIQQPMRTTAALPRHRHTYRAAPFDRDQGRAGSLHPGGLAAFWPHEDAQRCHLLRISEYHSSRPAPEWAGNGRA